MTMESRRQLAAIQFPVGQSKPNTALPTWLAICTQSVRGVHALPCPVPAVPLTPRARSTILVMETHDFVAFNHTPLEDSLAGAFTLLP